MAQKDGLSGYAMFEVLGQHRPERARTAPPEVHSAILEYVEQYVLGGGSPTLPTGTYTASNGAVGGAISMLGAEPPNAGPAAAAW